MHSNQWDKNRSFFGNFPFLKLVSSVQLEILLGHVDQILVLFLCDDTPDGLKSELALRALGAAKDHFESRGISVVKTNAVKQA